MATVTRHAEALLTAAALQRGNGPWIEATKQVVAELRLFQQKNADLSATPLCERQEAGM